MTATAELQNKKCMDVDVCYDFGHIILYYYKMPMILSQYCNIYIYCYTAAICNNAVAMVYIHIGKQEQQQFSNLKLLDII